MAVLVHDHVPDITDLITGLRICAFLVGIGGIEVVLGFYLGDGGATDAVRERNSVGVGVGIAGGVLEQVDEVAT